MGELIGSGSFGVVQKAQHKKSGKQYAVKQVPLPKPDADDGISPAFRQLEREMELMKRLDHPNIVRLLDTYEDDGQVFFVMDLCAGGHLLRFVARGESISEGQVAFVMRQIFSALGYMHMQDIIHRDLKLENCGMLNLEPLQNNVLKIFDFGLCVEAHDGISLRAKKGTPCYMAPQVFKGTVYDSSCDMWSCGVILYLLLCGTPPFFGSTSKDVETKVVKGNFSFNEEIWSEISIDARDLVRSLLKMLPRDRISADQANRHRWIVDMADHAGLDLDVILPMRVLEDLRRFERSGGRHASTRRQMPPISQPPGQLGAIGTWVNTLLNGYGCCSDAGLCVGHNNDWVCIDEVTHTWGADSRKLGQREDYKPEQMI
jgi:calcium-dependent protein kinase